MTNKPPQTVSEREEIARLREAAEKATPGPWFVWSSGAANDSPLVRGRSDALIVATVNRHIGPRVADNAAFIALANPATILALLDALALQAEGRRELVEAYTELADAVFGDLGSEPDVYADYDRLVELQRRFSALSKVVSGGGSSRDLSRSAGDPLEGG